MNKSSGNKEFDAALRTLEAADAEVARLSQRDVDLRAAIKKTDQLVAQRDVQLSGLVGKDLSFDELEVQSKALLQRKQNDLAWREHQTRMLEALGGEQAKAIRAALAAECAVANSQAALHKAAFEKSFSEFVDLCRKPLATLMNNAYRAALFEKLRTSGDLAVAQSEAMGYAHGLWASELDAAIEAIVEKDSTFLEPAAIQGTELYNLTFHASVPHAVRREFNPLLPQDVLLKKIRDLLRESQHGAVEQDAPPSSDLVAAAAHRANAMESEVVRLQRELSESRNKLQSLANVEEFRPGHFNSDQAKVKAQTKARIVLVEGRLSQALKDLESARSALASLRLAREAA
jgi:hypothetical protein